MILVQVMALIVIPSMCFVSVGVGGGVGGGVDVGVGAGAMLPPCGSLTLPNPHPNSSSNSNPVSSCMLVSCALCFVLFDLKGGGGGCISRDEGAETRTQPT